MLSSFIIGHSSQSPSHSRYSCNPRLIPSPNPKPMKTIRNKFALLAIVIAGLTTAYAQDPLPSWNDGKAKQSITEFVTKVTKEGSPDFVLPEERIATFDNDGTLWCEQPLYFQLLFALG